MGNVGSGYNRVSTQELTNPQAANNEEKQIEENIQAYKLYRFLADINNRRSYMHWSPIADKNLNPNPQIFGYKLATIQPFVYNGAHEFKVAVLLQLKIDTNPTNISRSECFEFVTGDKLQPTQKYCAKTVEVVAAKILGEPTYAVSMVNQITNGEAQIVSNFSMIIPFVYRIGSKMTEENAFQPGQGCLQGIHFFIDEKSAISYWRTGFLTSDIDPIILPAIKSTEDFKYDMENWKHSNGKGKKYEYDLQQVQRIRVA